MSRAAPDHKLLVDTLNRRRRLPLTALRAFEAAGRLRSVTAAADELALSPGAISQQVRLLEEHLNLPLVDRSQRRFALTNLGMRLLSRLEPCFRDLERGVEEMRGIGDPKRLRLNLSPAFASRWLAPRLARFFEACPNIDIELATSPKQDQPPLEEADFVVRVGVPPWPGLDTLLVFPEELIPVCAPAVAARLHEPSDLIGERLISSSLRVEQWGIWLQHVGMDPDLALAGQRFENAALAYDAAEAGAGVAIAQRAYVEDDLRCGRLVAPFWPPLSVPGGYWLGYVQSRATEPKIVRFIDWITQEIELTRRKRTRDPAGRAPGSLPTATARPRRAGSKPAV